MMILLDTSTPECRLTLVDGTAQTDVIWEAGRTLAHGLLQFLHDQLAARDRSWSDITAIGVYSGPGSFTGLRIGLTVCNTLARSEQIPIVGETGDGWRERALERLERGDNDRIVMPHYGSDAHITTPRK